MTTEDLREAAAERLRHGRLIITVKSKASGEHITLRLHCKNRDKTSRYCDLQEAKIVAVDSGRMAVSEDKDGNPIEKYTMAGKVGWTFADNIRRGRPTPLKPNVRHDRTRLAVAERVLDWMAGNKPMWSDAEINLSDHCSVCGRQLSDPISKKRGRGPECWGKTTGSRHQKPNPTDPEQQLLEV